MKKKLWFFMKIFFFNKFLLERILMVVETKPMPWYLTYWRYLNGRTYDGTWLWMERLCSVVIASVFASKLFTSQKIWHFSPFQPNSYPNQHVLGTCERDYRLIDEEKCMKSWSWIKTVKTAIKIHQILVICHRNRYFSHDVPTNCRL